MERLTAGPSVAFWLITSGLAACSIGMAAAAEPKQELNHVVIDGVKIPFDKTVEVVGPCLASDSFRDDERSLLGIRIEGRANQENIAFHLLGQTEEVVKRLRRLKGNVYIKVRGQIVGARVSGPHRVCNFKVDHFGVVPDAPLTPADFVGRVATFEGVAVPKGVVEVHGKRLLLAGLSAWPEKVERKKVSVRGKVVEGSRDYELSKPEWKLVELTDMVGQDASLDGTLWSLNDHWWFEYRDERLYLTSQDGPVLTFSGDHGRAATVTGKLAYQLRPSLSQISLKSDRDLVQTYVVRGAQVRFRDDSSTWHDRFGTVYATLNKVSDGVPELLAETSYRRNLLGNETTAMLFAERNSKVIAEIVQGATPEVRDVLVRRMNNASLNETLRLLYAAILARVNDERGREFLRKSAESPGDMARNEAYYCLGIFPFLGAKKDDAIETDCSWAEKSLVAIMSKPDTAEEASLYSAIPVVLIRINSPAARKVLLDYALTKEGDPRGFLGGPSAVSLLCHPSVKLPAEDLLRLEAVTEDQGTRRIILRALLRLKNPVVAERFLKDLDDGFAYMDFRDSSSPEVLLALKPQLSHLTGKAKSNVQMLLVLGEKDAVPALLALLNDAKFPDKNLPMFELARCVDRRAVSPVARVLREAPKEYFANDSELVITGGIQRALEAIANTRTRDAVRELIELIGVDLGRFGGYIDRAGLQRITAAHLIEITGESFGVDQAGWRAWEKAQPDERFHPAQPARNKGRIVRTGPDQRIDLGE